MNARWWQRGAIYQIYPRSFEDTNGDGVGDLNGTISRLPYLVNLGVDAIWLSPIYPSPMADFGYDVANYKDVNPVFGSLADIDRLIDAARSQGRLTDNPRLRSQPHVEPTSVVRKQPLGSPERETGLVHLERSARRRRTTKQLA